MATKNYMINDKWLDLDKQNIVELQSVDGELDSLKVNGSEVVTPSGKITITENGTDIDIAQYALADVNVEGGGGSSDFSTAEVTINVTGNVNGLIITLPCLFDGDLWTYVTQSTTYEVIIPDNKSVIVGVFGVGIQSVTAEGNISVDSYDEVYISGDGVINIVGLGGV